MCSTYVPRDHIYNNNNLYFSSKETCRNIVGCIGCAVFATFFIRFEASLSEYGSYSLYIRMFRYIHQHHLFASFASYSILNIRTNLNTNSRFVVKQINFLILANTCFKKFVLKRIFAKTNKFFHTSEYLLQNIRFEANIRKTLSEFYMQANIRLNSLANIRLQMFAYERIFAKYCFKL